MSKYRASITRITCPDCKAEITRFRSRNIPAYILDVICPSCGHCNRHIVGFTPELTNKIREWLPSEPAPQGLNTKHPTTKPPAMPPQLTLQSTIADPTAMAKHLETVKPLMGEPSPEERAAMDDMKARAQTLYDGPPVDLVKAGQMTEADLTTMKAQAAKLMANLTPEQKKQIQDTLEGKI